VSSAVASFIAHVAFWSLLVYGWAVGELGTKGIGVFLLLWVAGRVGLHYVPYSPAHAMFSSFVAVLAIALVFLIFKGDVRFFA
jgi:hypothetical protein